ncbi:MAG TPA: hypothetical protein VM367_13735 [Pseudonocardia sp.]|jgi:hypothetical protein|nr:hypothetical protein [Pseudonocardia sp.]
MPGPDTEEPRDPDTVGENAAEALGAEEDAAEDQRPPSRPDGGGDAPAGEGAHT